MSQLLVDDIVNKDDTGSPGFSRGAIITGVTTSTGFDGSGADLTNIPAAQLTGTLPAISGASLTGIDNINEGNTKAEVVDTGSDGHFKVETEGSERLRITSDGDVRIGTTNAVVFGSRRALTVANGTTGAVLSLYNNTTATNNPRISSNPGGSEINDIGIHAASTNGTIQFYTNNDTERLRVTSAGSVLVKTSTASPFTNRPMTLGDAGDSSNYLEVRAAPTGSCGVVFSDATTNDSAGYRGSIEYNHTYDYLWFRGAGVERLRVTSSGQVFVGTDTATADHNFGIGMLQVTNKTGYQHVQFDGHSDAAANATCLSIGRSRGTQASPTVLQNGDHIARLSANAYNLAVTAYMGSACIDFYADKNHASGDIPGYISFKTCHDGSASLDERVKIHSAGSVLFKAGILEKNRVVGATLGATVNTSLNDGNTVIFNGNESGNNTVNFQNVHTPMIENSVVTFTVMIDPNNSGVINAVQIDGQTPAGGLKWKGGSQPTAGSSGKDIYTFTITKYGTGATSYTVYGDKNNYA